MCAFCHSVRRNKYGENNNNSDNSMLVMKHILELYHTNWNEGPRWEANQRYYPLQRTALLLIDTRHGTPSSRWCDALSQCTLAFCSIMCRNIICSLPFMLLGSLSIQFKGIYWQSVFAWCNLRTTLFLSTHYCNLFYNLRIYYILAGSRDLFQVCTFNVLMPLFSDSLHL